MVQVASRPCSSTMKMEATSYSETSADFQELLGVIFQKNEMCILKDKQILGFLPPNVRAKIRDALHVTP
jgi:hypothetical protein